MTTVDCVSVTGAGGFPSTFCGTSAAAPHAAAVAALLLQANPTLSPAQVLSAMQVTAADRGAAGFDNTFGAGLVNALTAVTSVNQLKKRPGQITSAYLRTTQDSEYSSFWLAMFGFLSGPFPREELGP